GQAVGSFDAIWFSSNRYLSLHPEAEKRIGSAVPIMRSPVVLGVREQVAEDLWPGVQPSWAEVAARAQNDELDFGMTNPASSNTGVSGLVSIVTALSPEDGPITVSQIQQAGPELQALFSAQELTAGSSGWLKDAYLKRMRDGTPIDAIINYESVLLS